MKISSMVITGLVLLLLIFLSVMASEVADEIPQSSATNEGASRQHKHIAGTFFVITSVTVTCY